MSESYSPVTYVKGDDERVAKNAAQAVALAFDGYKPKESDQDAAQSAPSETPKPQAPRPPATPQEPVNP